MGVTGEMHSGDSIERLTVRRPILGRQRATRAFSVTRPMAVDIAPGIRVDEAEFVGGHADDFTVLCM